MVISVVGKYKYQKYQNSSPTIFIENVQVTFPYVPNNKSEAGVHLRGIREITAHFKNDSIHIFFAFSCMALGKFRLTMTGGGYYCKLNQVAVPVTSALTSLLMHPRIAFYLLFIQWILITDSY